MVVHTAIRELGRLRKEDRKLGASQDPAQNEEKETKAKTPKQQGIVILLTCLCCFIKKLNMSRGGGATLGSLLSFVDV